MAEDPPSKGEVKARESPPVDRRRRLLLLRPVLIASLALFAIRLHTASGLGFGDAEALYASYALHPQPAYLDHPGLIGLITRLLGGGGAPSPETAHTFTALVATLVPWLGGLAARAAGASWVGTRRTIVCLLLCPELSIGLFGLTPDLPLAALWLGALALALMMLRSQPGSYRALLSALGCGALLGLACLAKVSAGLLALALLTVLLTRQGRAHLRSFAPWGALLVFAVLLTPLVRWEVDHGYPMLQHRLVATQGDAGFSMWNLGKLFGGQIVYLTPPFAYGVILAAHRLFRLRAADGPTLSATLLWQCFWIPLIPLVALSLWSRAAEPHWVAPAYLALAVGIALGPALQPWLVRSAIAFGVLAVVAGWVLVKTPLQPMLAGDGYRARYDLTNDLHAWGPAAPALREAVAAAKADTGTTPVVVGPHYIVCAQAHAALGEDIPVGCLTRVGDDFQLWYPGVSWHQARTLIFVTDDRFAHQPGVEFPRRREVSRRRAPVRRGDTLVRTVRIFRLEKDIGVAGAQKPTPPLPQAPEP